MTTKTSPTQRTLTELRKQGCQCSVSEYWLRIDGHPAGGIRRDLFGFIDLIALRHGRIVAIQATSGTNTSARVEKIRNERWEAASEWLKCGGIIEVWGWRKLKKKVGNQCWFPKVVSVEFGD